MALAEGTSSAELAVSLEGWLQDVLVYLLARKPVWNLCRHSWWVGGLIHSRITTSASAAAFSMTSAALLSP